MVSSDDRYCTHCGENNPKFVEVKTTTSSTSYSTTSTYSSSNTVQEGSGIGWLFFGLFFPFIGIILYFSFKREKPNAAGMSLTGAVIRIILMFLILG
jgi:hypothetical protein